jgi:ribosome biogenesis GTPase
LSGRAKKRAHNIEAGTVVASFGRQFAVEVSNGRLITCVTRGKRTDIACGDRVDVGLTSPNQGVIESIAARTSLFYRSDVQREKLIAANVTRVVVVLAPSPPFHIELLDRCLAAAEDAGIHALLALNKMDLPSAAAVLASLALYARLGYEVVQLAAKIDIAPLRACLATHTSVLVGQSGMGKSTIINRLLPDAPARVADLSAALGSGRHTTTHARLYHLAVDSHIIDSPGLQEFGLVHVEPEDLARCFIEFKPYLGQCKFNDCKHLSEPGCAIVAAVESSAIAPSRLASYRTLVTQLMKKARRWD